MTDPANVGEGFSTSLESPSRPWLVSIYVFSLSLWIGGSAFFTAGVLPALFLNMPPSDAGRIAAIVFPIYFRAGLAVGVVATLSAWALSRGGGRRWHAAFMLLLVMVASQAWTTLVIHPEMARIRGVEAEVPRFQELHHRSVNLNAVVLGGGIVLLALSGRLLARRRDDA
ncbi:MAG TPA: DUF4149 domain-containing protein [Candidatus Binatia bacterium]|jgi:hypothetical protein